MEKYDLIIVGAGPAGIFTAVELLRRGSKKHILLVEKGKPVEKRHCPKAEIGHCEARVKKALEALPEVDEAVVSHETGTAIVTLNAEVADDVLKKAVEDQDYPVTGIQ